MYKLLSEGAKDDEDESNDEEEVDMLVLVPIDFGEENIAGTGLMAAAAAAAGGGDDTAAKVEAWADADEGAK